MRIFKSLCRFKMCADVEDSLVVKSLAFVNRNVVFQNVVVLFNKGVIIIKLLIIAILLMKTALFLAVMPFGKCPNLL